MRTRHEPLTRDEVNRNIEAQGWAVIENLLTPEECRSFTELYDQEASFRSRIIMARHGFGQGEYRYFAYPLPPRLEELRSGMYSTLVSLANDERTHEHRYSTSRSIRKFSEALPRRRPDAAYPVVVEIRPGGLQPSVTEDATQRRRLRSHLSRAASCKLILVHAASSCLSGLFTGYAN